MSVFPSWPWTNFHEENLDWLISQVKKLSSNASQIVSKYFSDHIDDTLTVSGDAADSKTVGDRLGTVNSSLTNLSNRVDSIVSDNVQSYQFNIEPYVGGGHYCNIEPKDGLSGGQLVLDLYSKLSAKMPVNVVVRINYGTAGSPKYYYTRADVIEPLPSSGIVITGIMFTAGEFYVNYNTGTGGVATFKKFIIDQVNSAYIQGGYAELDQFYKELHKANSILDFNIVIETATVDYKVTAIEKGTNKYILHYNGTTVDCNSNGTFVFN